MTKQLVVAGGGIGGLAAALGASHAGWEVRLFERTAAFAEVGAGLQLGPNAVHLLQHWGLGDALAAVAAFPDKLQVRSAPSGALLAEMRLDSMRERYGAPYATVHRADLHALLLQAVRATGARLHLGRPLESFSQTAQALTLQAGDGPAIEADALVGADGLWSAVRAQLLGDGPPRATGHLAYRTLLPMDSLPAALRSTRVTAWLGPRLHAVQYPVRGGEWLNLVVIAHGEIDETADTWDHAANAAGLGVALAGVCPALRETVAAGPHWRLWPLMDRRPVSAAVQQAQGRVALLGDAAHPMLPYLAQGAGMAIEDAAELGRVLVQALDPALDVPTMLQRYALNRWQRNARVQARAQRNGRIFHSTGLLRWGRDASLRLLGEKLLDMPWLYGAR